MKGEEVEKIRISLGWSKSELARRLDVTDVTIFNYTIKYKEKDVPGPVAKLMKIFEKGVLDY